MVLIKRRNRSSTNGKPDPPEVYVTGPHFSREVFSSTIVAAEATPFEEAEADRLCTLKWRGLRPETVPIEQARDLEAA